ncbi:MAG: argininosuccinate lyase [Candidatus Nezhaarchaeales archaeon]|nr:MAG: argininosuccinate lyase [Candidatus Nezhaarchaeota archaeon WYZ-LMO8]TDA36593.1 MAG: argininosuccinate lyase [Candidatus Nezhaarchaeota archaeon WYZ-LMO7]
MWEARIKTPSIEATQYISSISFDDRIALDVVRVNIAHLLMLVKQGIINVSDGRAIYGVLKRLLQGFSLRPQLEDVHMHIEDEVIKEVGVSVGGKLHTGKSRNDQVATALRMTAKRVIIELAHELLKLRETLLSQCEKHINTIMPGYTHLQHAQPITLAHHLLAYHDKFDRDFKRLLEVYERVDESPMGSAALAGSSFNLDREYVAKLLGFSKIEENTVDAVSDRDFMVELAFAAAMIMIHLSQIAEELVLWSTWEFGFVELPDAYSSTSSIMPQKKNPVVAEVVRARASQVLGMLFSALSILKRLPLSYNLDLQEVTPSVWFSVEETLRALRIIKGVIEGLQFDVKRMHDAAELGFSTVTELANEIVRRFNLPFRVAYRIVGRLVKEAVDAGLTPNEITSEMLEKVALCEGVLIKIDEEVIRESLNPEMCVAKCKVSGGPSQRSVVDMINGRKLKLLTDSDRIIELKRKIEEIDLQLESEAKRLGAA